MHNGIMAAKMNYGIYGLGKFNNFIFYYRQTDSLKYGHDFKRNVGTSKKIVKRVYCLTKKLTSLPCLKSLPKY